jgi:3'-phosphoadenosine 5'-phosphosulfate sulfotransferase (PAPS reductase)/FAD synthetase
MSKHTLQELKQWQALPLNIKVLMTKDRIRQWIKEYGEDGVYVSFSGGKDSTVLLHMVRENYPKVPAVFVDTGLEYPEIRNFVKTFDNVEWLRPKLTFKQVIEKYGYPFFSKETSEAIYEARKYLTKAEYEVEPLTDRQTDSRRILGGGGFSRNPQAKREQRQRRLSEAKDGDYP